MKKIELLAPAGNPEALKAAVSAGCDAVYLGLTSFSARAFAGNFTHEQYLEAIRYCHIRDVKIYVTVNTLMYENEIDAAMAELRFLYENDVDGVMIQDFGLFHKARLCFPDLPLFCSTQMHIHNADGAAFMKQQGASRVVAARETPLSVIRDMVSTGIEVEVFAYGALCISYSGQCLMSQAMKQRSGNRGICAQMCRMKYKADDRYAKDGEYLLSPRDLNLIERIPELIGAGVSSLKIEGRMKRPEYVYLVIKTFREAIDACYEGRPYHLSRERMQDLKLMFNRDFTEGHIFSAAVSERMNHFRPNHMGITIGTITEVRKGKVRVHLKEALHQHDGLRIIDHPEDIGLIAVRIEKNGKLVNSARSGEQVWLDCPADARIHKGSLLQKTSDYLLLKEIGSHIGEEKTSEIRMEYTAEPETPLILTVSDGMHTVTAVSDQLCDYARNAPLDSVKLERSLCRTGDGPYRVAEISGTCGHVFLPVSIINETRRAALEQLDELRAHRHLYSPEQPYTLTLEHTADPAEQIIISGIRNSIEPGILSAGDPLPVISENGSTAELYENRILSQPGDFNRILHDCTAGMNLNIANSYACAFFLQIPGIRRLILSSEMKDINIDALINAFEERYGFHPPVYVPVYGRRVLMYIKDGFLPEWKTVHTLTDVPGNHYPVTVQDRTACILEPEPIRREPHPRCGSYVMITDENIQTVKRIAEEIYEEIYH